MFAKIGLRAQWRKAEESAIVDEMVDFLPEFMIFCQIVLIDVTLAGDNAVAIGMSAAGLPAQHRHKAILWGIVVAAFLRFGFALFAVKLLRLAGVLAVGGLLLLWVASKMYQELRRAQRAHARMPEHREATADQIAAERVATSKPLSSAIIRIAVADISMSLDNVLAVAGVARNHTIALIFGLGLSVLLMGAAAAVVARIVGRHRWIAWVGLLVVLYTALTMIWEGAHQLLTASGVT